MSSRWHLDQQSSSSLLSVENTRKKKRGDRFVYFKRRLQDEDQGSQSRSQTPDGYAKYICDSLGSSPQSVSLRGFTLSKTAETRNRVKQIANLRCLRNQNMKPFRKYAVIGWKDNYYTNLLDWSHDYMICTGYQNQLNLYNIRIDDQNEKSFSPHKLYVNADRQNLTSLKVSPIDCKVVLGYSNGTLKLYDYQKQRSIHNWHYHILRIAALQWQGDLILSGSKDQHLKVLDPRAQKLLQTQKQMQNAHIQQVCGIKKKQNYIASGGNDNKVFIYDLRKQTPIHSYGHNAAVKALTWIDYKSLVTGGGTADKSLKVFSLQTSSIKSIDTGSQVCNLCWNSNTQELISCQGFSLNQIIVWSKNFQRQFTFHGHATRVLYCAMSPDSQYLASGAGDQSLKIWKIFPQKDSKDLLTKQQIR